MKQTIGHLEFALSFDPWDENLKVLRLEKEYSVELTITSVDSPTFSHRGIDYEFCTEITPCGAKPLKAQQTNLRLSESSTISKTTSFQLPKVTFPEYTQTYHGALFTVRHFIRVWVRKLIGSEFFEQELEVYRIIPYANFFEPFYVRVNIGDSLGVDYLISRRKYDINDVILGQVRFSNVDLQVKILRVQIVAQEMFEINNVSRKFKNILNYWELAYGTPVNNEVIPFRLFLSPVQISPSCSNPKYGYSATHFLHFTIVTNSGDKYYKSLQVGFYKMDRLPFFFTGEDDAFVEKLEAERKVQEGGAQPSPSSPVAKDEFSDD